MLFNNEMVSLVLLASQYREEFENNKVCFCYYVSFVLLLYCCIATVVVYTECISVREA